VIVGPHSIGNMHHPAIKFAAKSAPPGPRVTDALRQTVAKCQKAHGARLARSFNIHASSVAHPAQQVNPSDLDRWIRVRTRMRME
jgi:hypothetical protein